MNIFILMFVQSNLVFQPVHHLAQHNSTVQISCKGPRRPCILSAVIKTKTEALGNRIVNTLIDSHVFSDAQITSVVEEKK